MTNTLTFKSEGKLKEKNKKTILMVLAETEFRDLEYIVPKTFFESENFDVITTSTDILSTGKFGYKVYHDESIDYYCKYDFDALVFVGGSGSLDLAKNEDLKKMTQRHIELGKIVASICAAPRNLIKWGLVKGKKITGHNWDNNFENLATQSGAIPEMQGVVIDGNIITADGPESVEEFSKAIIQQLT